MADRRPTGLRNFTVIVVLLVLLTGCTGLGPADNPMESTSTAPTQTPTLTPIETSSPFPTVSPPPEDNPSPTAAPTSTGSTTPTPRGPAQGIQWTVTITRVIDGDTVEARFPNGEMDTLRLLGVDTPETTLSRVSPEVFEGIPDTTSGRDHLFNWGEMATIHAEDRLDGKTVRIEVDPESDRRGSFGRLLVYIYIDGENFNKRLLTSGYARMY